VRWPRRLPIFLFVACSMPAAVVAQTTTGNVQLGQYQPSPFADRILRLDGSTVLPFGQYRVGIDVDYALRPLVLIDAAPGIFQGGSGPNHNIVEHALGGSLAASFGLSHKLEAGISLPLTLFQAGQAVAGAVDPSIAGAGNLRIGLKARLLDWHRWGVGASLSASVPSGVGTLTHESGFGGEGRLFADYHRGRLTLGARAGFNLRGRQMFYDIPLGNELTFTTGATVRAATRTTFLAELSGVTAAGSPFGNRRQSPLEALVGVRQRVGKTWLTLAAGPGLIDGYGSPLFRVVAGFTWANRPPDADGDGVPDDDDLCPTVPEDRDGFQDSDGCPDPDNDKDGIPDATDKCPNDPEDKDGFEDADGCPDPDNDKDGILDATDKCPDQPETVNDFEDEDGCPDESPLESDKDKDGIPDDVDECPEEPEDKDGFEDEDGCPDPDNDKDGIPDTTDKCPLEPETINGIDDDDGCPDKGQAQVRLGKNEIETLKPIYFDTDRSRVRHAFHNIMGQIASLLKAHPEIGRCAVEGHTDDTGPPDWNQKLSVLRAESVIEFLANKGVDPKRLVPIGHGEHLPWASNETPSGRAMNRRVLFHIEGVNVDEEKKQDLRQERRRRIRHHREHERQKREDAAEHARQTGVAPSKDDVAPGTPAVDAKPSPKSGDKPVTPSAAPGAAATPAPPGPKSPSKSEPKAGTPPESPASKTKGKTTSPPEKSDAEKPSTKAPSPTEKTDPEKSTGKTNSATAKEELAPPAARDAKDEPTSRGTKQRLSSPDRFSKKSPDAGSGPPPTLRELLKLPPPKGR
jgi:large repetitive protein